MIIELQTEKEEREIDRDLSLCKERMRDAPLASEKLL